MLSPALSDGHGGEVTVTRGGLPCCWSCQLLVKVQAELMYLMEKDTLPRLKQHKAFVEYFEKVGG